MNCRVTYSKITCQRYRQLWQKLIHQISNQNKQKQIHKYERVRELRQQLKASKLTNKNYKHSVEINHPLYHYKRY